MAATAQFGQNFNPSAVMLGQSGKSPYMWTGTGKAPVASASPSGQLPTSTPVGSTFSPAATASLSGAAPTQPPSPSPIASATPGNVVGPESIRATGTGPFDSAYRQNLATYAGGQFARPASGTMSFNPTDPNTFPGNPTGGGSAPVTGMPSSLMDMALGGQGFSWTPPPAPQTANSPGNFQTLQDWMNQFLMQGRNGRMGSVA